MELWWPDPFERYLNDLEAKADRGDERSEQILTYIYAAMATLRDLPAQPREDSQSLKRVRQSGRYTVWRVSHPYVEGLAVRVICWFPPEESTVVIALFSGEKANMGDVFYDSVAQRADHIIDIWCQEE